jgi:septal ring factor EnvC (AmiA/AmiB activator)
MKTTQPRSNIVYYVALGAAFLGMGMSMPSCPGQQAMQEQVDKLTQQNLNLNKRTESLESQIKSLNSDMTQVKTLLKPMADAIQAQKAGMDQLDANLKEIQTKLAAAASSKGGAKKRR